MHRTTAPTLGSWHRETETQRVVTLPMFTCPGNGRDRLGAQVHVCLEPMSLSISQMSVGRYNRGGVRSSLSTWEKIRCRRIPSASLELELFMSPPPPILCPIFCSSLSPLCLSFSLCHLSVSLCVCVSVSLLSPSLTVSLSPSLLFHFPS